jgi:soluble lytic murein transglycosylase
VLARRRLTAGDGDGAQAALEALARDDSIGYYGTIARDAARMPLPEFPPPPSRAPAPEVRQVLHELDLLDAALFTEEADRLLRYLLARSWDDPDHLLDLADGLILRGRTPEGISLGWRVAGRVGLNHPRVIRVVFPWPERELIEVEARKFGLDPFLLAGLIRQESSFKAAAQSRAGALGWMQLMPATGNWLARRLAVPWSDRMFTIADANLHLGSAHLAALLEQFGGAIVPALAAYNAGGTPVRRWLRARDASDAAMFIETIPYAETREYVKTLLRNRALYRALYGPQPAAGAAPPGALDSLRNRRPE